MSKTATFTLFLMLRSTPAWLALSRAERAAYIDEAVRPIFARYPPTSTRFFDAEAFSGRCSDVLMIETGDLRRYAFLVDALRDIAFFGAPYFEVLEIIPSMEDAYQDYDNHLAQAAGVEA